MIEPSKWVLLFALLDPTPDQTARRRRELPRQAGMPQRGDRAGLQQTPRCNGEL